MDIAASPHGAALDGVLIGRTLDGRYTVQSRVAQGGMATVFRAWDNRLDRMVALKVIDPELARHPEYVSRFIREAKSAARLTHPNIVGVYDQSALPGRPGAAGLPGQPPLAYLAMEYVPGITLRQLLGRRGRLNPREALEIVDAMLAGLAAAHRAGIVHRDVKPENVLLGEEALAQHRSYAAAVKVTDFGLARTVTGDQNSSSLGAPGSPTRDTGLIGTVSYLAPELVEHGTCDARSDVYSAGIVLYELLTGRKPFTGGTPVEIAQRHVTDRVPPPSVLVPGLDPAIDALVAAACARDPRIRPADAAALRAQVRAVYANLPDSALDFGPAAGGESTVALTAAQVPDHTRLDVGGPLNTQILAHTGVSPRTIPRRSPREPQVIGTDGRRPIRGLVIFIVVLLIALAVGFGAWLYGQLAFKDTPRLVGLSQSQATAALEHDGLKYRILSGLSDQVSVGQVISTAPDAGTPVKNGATISLTISHGSLKIAVPDVKGRSQSDATSALENAGFKVSIAADQVTSNTVAAGSVVSYDPSGTADKGSTVTLTLSSGPQQVTVPDVTGMKVADATAQLQEAGFTVATTRVLPFVDNVGRQSPGGQSSAAYGSTVTLYIY